MKLPLNVHTLAREPLPGLKMRNASPADCPDGIRRITVSMPEETFQMLDRLVNQRGFDSRSQAISEMIHQRAAEHISAVGTEIMAGALTLVYDESKSSLLRDLARICREHVAEVISSQHILLEDEHVMEVILMQGPSRTLHAITNKLVTCKGVKRAQLTLSPHLMPPLHTKAGPVIKMEDPRFSPMGH